MESKFYKELLIILLLFVTIMLTIVALFYDYFSFSENKVKSIEYRADESVEKVIQEIQENTTIGANEERILKKYIVDKTDNSDGYEIGKQDPFAEISESTNK